MRVLVMTALCAMFLAGCSPSGEQPAEAASGEAAAHQAAAFEPTLLDKPLLEFYEPGFDYHLRNRRRDDRDDGRVRIVNNMEIRGVAQEEAIASIDQAFLARGYERRGGEWKDGTYRANYRKPGASTVYVLIRDISAPYTYESPDATGFMRISWSRRSRSEG